jgi:hypothetical protein
LRGVCQTVRTEGSTVCGWAELSAWRPQTVRAALVLVDHPGTRHGPSVIQGAVLEVLLSFSYCPLEGCGLSAQCLRTIRPGLAIYVGETERLPSNHTRQFGRHDIRVGMN